jgi:hypothetical protein
MVTNEACKGWTLLHWLGAWPLVRAVAIDEPEAHMEAALH